MSELLFCILLAAVTIDGNDWQADGRVTLSLRPTISDSEGTAWLVRKGSDGELSAFTGRYERENSAAVPGVYLCFSHRWDLKADQFGTPRWQLDYDYLSMASERYGVFAEYEEGSQGLDVSVLRSFEIDRRGNRGEQIAPRDSHLMTGDVIKLSAGSIPELAWQPPPGFVRRDNWRNRIREKPNTIYRTDVLERDWYGWAVDQSRYLVLSLEAGKSWDAGEARLLVVCPGGWYVFARGKYNIDLTLTPDSLTIELLMVRHYYFRDDGGPVVWTVSDTSEEPTGLTLCVPLDDQGFRGDLHTTYVSEAFYVNETGERERRYNDDAQFLRTATEKAVDSVFGISVGTTFTVRSGGLFAGSPSSLTQEKSILGAVQLRAPPGFRLRSRAQAHVVARPSLAGADTVGGLGADELKELGNHAYDKAQYADAIAAFTQLGRMNPNDAYPHIMLGHCHYMQEDYVQALAEYDIATKLKPTVDSYVIRAGVSRKLGRYASMVKDYKAAYAIDPKNARVLNLAAWLWATCPDASIRDGNRAVTAARKACELTEYKVSDFVDTLAAAYAESGDFVAAVAFQRDACEKLGGEDLVRAKERLALFERREPYREP